MDEIEQLKADIERFSGKSQVAEAGQGRIFSDAGAMLRAMLKDIRSLHNEASRADEFGMELEDVVAELDDIILVYSNAQVGGR